MEPYLGLDDARRTLDGTSTASFATHSGGYPAPSVPKQNRASYWNQEFSRAAAIVHTLCSSATTIPLPCTCYKTLLIDLSHRRCDYARELMMYQRSGTSLRRKGVDIGRTLLISPGLFPRNYGRIRRWSRKILLTLTGMTGCVTILQTEAAVVKAGLSSLHNGISEIQQTTCKNDYVLPVDISTFGQSIR